MTTRLGKVHKWHWDGALVILKWPVEAPKPNAEDVENQAGPGGNGARGDPAAPGQTNSTTGALQTSQPDTGGRAGEMMTTTNGLPSASTIS
ncbi:hypothetical protein IFM47457_08716 [Aspergillus lentulus]|nr:hypothetical protein IFM47457_08716 [Aspergillus lentulus]